MGRRVWIAVWGWVGWLVWFGLWMVGVWRCGTFDHAQAGAKDGDEGEGGGEELVGLEVEAEGGFVLEAKVRLAVGFGRMTIGVGGVDGQSALGYW